MRHTALTRFSDAIAPIALGIALVLLGCGGGEGDSVPREPEVVERTVVSSDGTEIWFRSVGGERSDAKAIVLVHGGPGLASTYLEALEQLASPSQRVVRFNQRGLGGSSMPKSLDYRLDRHREDIDAVTFELGLERFSLFGHSWGGYVAMGYAVHAPERVESLVLADSLPARSQEVAIAFAARKARIEKLQAEGLIVDPLPSGLCEWVAAILPAYFHDPYFTPPPELASNECNGPVGDVTWKQTAGADFDFTQGLRELEFPVLVVVGESDFMSITAESTAARFDPDAPVEIVRRAGHFPWLEQPDATLALVREFTE